MLLLSHNSIAAGHMNGKLKFLCRWMMTSGCMATAVSLFFMSQHFNPKFMVVKQVKIEDISIFIWLLIKWEKQ